MLANDEIYEIEIEEEQREELLFTHIHQNFDSENSGSFEMQKFDSELEDIQKFEVEGEDSFEEGKISTAKDPQKIEEEEELIITTKAEAQKQMEEDKNITEIAETVYEETKIPEAWSRTRFVTNEQKVRSILGLGYNIHLNEIEYDLIYDQEQEHEIEKEIEALKEKILEIVDKILSEQDPSKILVLMSIIEEIAEF